MPRRCGDQQLLVRQPLSSGYGSREHLYAWSRAAPKPSHIWSGDGAQSPMAACRRGPFVPRKNGGRVELAFSIVLACLLSPYFGFDNVALYSLLLPGIPLR